MKNIIYIFLIALCTACFAGYFEVPQRTAADYIFTLPLLTNGIQGKVIDPSEPYGAIRSEDVDWIHEALAERYSLQGGDFAVRRPGTGARISVDNSWISPIGWVDSPDAWLDPAAPLLTGVRLSPYAGVPDLTNVVVRSTYTNAVSNAFSVVEMPMTNGTVSVWTNKWSADVLLPSTETVTNVHEWTPLDLCHGVAGEPFPMYTNTPRVSYGTLDRAFRRIPSAQSISNAYAVLRGTKRLADVGVLWTNHVLYVEEDAYGGNGAPTYHRTNSVSSFISGARYQLSASCQTNGYWSTLENHVIPFTADIPTRFYSSLVTTGGANRVSIEAAFVYLYFSYFFRDDRRPDSSRIVQTNAILRLSSPSLDTSGERARVMVALDIKACCSAVAEAAGCPAVPSAGVMYAAPIGEHHAWDADEEGCVIIYSIAPSVKLPDW